MKNKVFIILSITVLISGYFYGYFFKNIPLWTLSMVISMLILWITNAIPIGATALLPIIFTNLWKY